MDNPPSEHANDFSVSKTIDLPSTNITKVKDLLASGCQLYVFQPAQALVLPCSVYSDGFPLVSTGGMWSTYTTAIGTRGPFLGSNLKPLVLQSSDPEVRTLGMIALSSQAIIGRGSGTLASVQLYPPMEWTLHKWVHRDGWSASYFIGDGTRETIFLRVPTENGSSWAHIETSEDLEHAKSLQPHQDKRTGWGWSGTEELPCPARDLPNRGMPFARHGDDGKPISVALKGEDGTSIVSATVIKPGCTALRRAIVSTD